MQSDVLVKINAAMTVDGKIATICGDSNISSKQDLKRVHYLRSSVDAIMVGITTVVEDDPMLSARLSRKGGQNPLRIIIDSTARMPVSSRILRSANRIRTLVAVTTRAPIENIKKIESSGATVLIAGRQVVDLRQVFSILKNIGIRRTLVEGGGELNWSVLRQGLVSDLIVTVAPVIAGGRNATTLVEGQGYSTISKAIKLSLKKVSRQKNGEVILHYKLE
jgi:2,5-diamino-6-(ribosylamino)-4(3H)-pyrimidinone 5'-phosphate reductase